MKNINILNKTLPSIILSILCLIYFFNIIIAKNFLWEDFAIYYFPAKNYVFTELKNGHLPLWNQNLNFGYPIIADTTASIFYPLNWLVIPFVTEDLTTNYWLIEMWAIFHLLLAGVFIYYLIDYLIPNSKQDKSFFYLNYPALLAGITFMFSGFFIGHLKHIAQITTACWLPLIFLFLHKTLREKKYKYSIYTGIIWSIAVLSGHLQIIYHISFWLGLYILWQIISDFIAKKNYQKTIFLTLIITLIIIGLTAIHILPFLEFLQNSTREQVNSQFSTSFSLAPIEFLTNLLLPHTYGGFTQYNEYWGYGGTFWETSIYLGFFTIVLAIITIIRSWLSEDKFKLFLIFSSLVCIGLAFGGFFIIHPLFSIFLPGLNSIRAPVRFMLPALFALIVLASFGFNYFIKFIENVKNNESNKKNIKKFLKILIFILIGFFIFLISYKNNNKIIRIQNILDNLLSLTLIILSIIFSILLKIKNHISLKKFKMILVAIVFIDLFIFGWKFNNGKITPLEYYPDNQTTRFLTSQKNKQARFINDDLLMPNSAYYYNVPTMDSNHYMIIKNFYDLTSGLAENRYYWNEYRNFDKLFASKNFLDLLGVNYVISERNWSKWFPNKISQNIYTNQENISRYVLSEKAEMLNDNKIILQNLQSDYNPSGIIYLDENFTDLNNTNKVSVSENKIEILEHKNEYQKIKIFNQDKNWLLAKEIYYPGWQAKIDGQPTKIFKANIALRAIQIPYGEHVVEFEFIPKSYIIGRIISVITLTVILLFFAFVLAKKSRIK
jgi:hypothetical protein